MTDLEFAALLVSRVCHDLVSPVGAVMNGLEVLEDERDAAMRADALKLVTSSAAQAAARRQGLAGMARRTAQLAKGLGEAFDECGAARSRQPAARWQSSGRDHHRSR